MNVKDRENWNVSGFQGGGLDYSGFLDRFLREPSPEDVDRDFGFQRRRPKRKVHEEAD